MSAIISNKMRNSLNLQEHRLLLKCNGMSGFHAEREYPNELNGLIHPLDYKYILYKFNAQVHGFKANLIRTIITNMITVIISTVLLILSSLHISSQWLNLEITASIGTFGLLLSLYGIHALNKGIMKNLEADTLELSSRYRELGIQFVLVDKPKSDSENGLTKLICTASNYNIEVMIRSGSSNSVNDDISISINATATSPLINI
ncbi:hypothetical protein SAMD00019534_061340 [Acytostelium subglobosum LB1]|uniref:hypothetical protein n=1 Tax=Acytostelium subglobosum LB1 TaxID=1410327 RepID=UPI000644DAA3|nr:hypothetical protein SAMD00019534_061340 [Acytostelium subglobosum LB1]GAM22959.1 hypothetical protein SAMD00019534_061340 [Acytostelium subglobosum LB1]|eukprot:XP_012754186.1 hypothetical protein SAMD00019534_061340 [Acytostelium subglobosum LB1]